MGLQFTNRPGLVVYVTCGDPKLEITRDVVLEAIDAGADVVELGVPFSDPVADGPVIQRASERALQRGTRLGDVLKLAAEVRRRRPEAGLIVFSYLNPILRMGLARFCASAEEAGLDGALVTDLPVEEAEEYLREMRKRNLAPVFLAAPTSPDARLKSIARASAGFVYAVARTGITGARSEFPPEAKELVARIRRHTKLPVAVGFGISTAAQFVSAGQFADAVVVGSAIVETIERNVGREAEAVGTFVRSLVQSRGQAAGVAKKEQLKTRPRG
jgi:tryptophan synthase alpha chain